MGSQWHVRPSTVPLPPNVTSALGSIASDLRHLPRDCIMDRAELLHWLNRMARRVDGVAAIRVQAAGSAPKPPPLASASRPARLSPRDQAEAVFGKAPPTAPSLRTITSKGRTVRVETRRARAAGQMELGL